MDERDKDLTHLFVRDLDGIPLPPRGAWRRAPRKEHLAMRTSRSVLTAGAAVAVLVLALVVGLQLRDRTDTAAAPTATPRPSPSGSTAPGAVVPSATPSGSASPAPASAASVLSDGFGFLVIEVGSAATIRSETGTSVSSLNGTRYVVSPTGDRIAYVVSEGGRGIVHVRTLAGNADLVGPSFGQDDSGVTGIAWSGDGTGLLIGSGRGADTGAVPQPPARLQTFDLATGALTVIATRQDGRVYAPIAWDRAAKIAAAAETGAGGFGSAYLTFDLSQSPVTVRSTPITGRSSIPRASSDAKLVLAQDTDSREIRYWPLADISAMRSAGTAAALGPVLWQPGSHRIGSISGDAFVLFSADDGSTVTVVRGLKAGTPTQPGAQLRTFRADGSAIVTAVPTGAGLGATDYTVTRIADGASAVVQMPGALVESVRLR